jgi:hypothetical protein
MNVNYIGSFAEQNMMFRSSVDVVEAVSNEPFHCLSVYIPSNIAPAVIRGYENDAVLLTKTKPLVYSCDVQNYADIMQGELLTQMQPIFRDDSNTEVIIYLVVFYCDGLSTDWEVSATAIEYGPLTVAFEKLYFISYLKMLFDPNMNGSPVSVPSIGTKAHFNFTAVNTSVTTRAEGSIAGSIVNDTASSITLPAGTFETDNHYSIVIGTGGVVIPANSTVYFGRGLPEDVDVVVMTTADFEGALPLSLPLAAADLTTLAAGSPITWGAISLILSSIISTGQAAGNPVAVTIDAGDYVFTDADGVVYDVNIPVTINFPASGSQPSRSIMAIGAVVGNLADDVTVTRAGFSPAFGRTTSILTPGTVSFTFTPTDFVAGSAAGIAQTITSQFFDLSLALAYLCKLNQSLSQFWSQVRIQLFDAGFPNVILGAGEKLSDYDPNKCWIRSASVAEETAGIPDLSLASAESRAKFYWAALKLMQANNTFLSVHCEPNDLTGMATNILSEVLAVWFANVNSSGLYVGNKVHNIRLSSANIKPLGWPSPLNNAVNENDAKAVSVLVPKGVAYLQTISDNSLENCRLTYARTLDGISLNAKMISKWVDYRSAMECANLITDKGTLTDPELTNNEAYIRIQSIVGNNLAKFSNTKRLYNVKLTFPSFATAKVGLNALEAGSAWSALYVDDLDKVTVTGGIAEL